MFKVCGIIGISKIKFFTFSGIQRVKEIEVSKWTVYFKVKLVKLLAKYPKIKCLSLSLNFSKDYAKIIQEVCEESGDQFK